MLVDGIPLKFLPTIARGCIDADVRHTSLLAVTLEARIAVDTRTELPLAVKRFSTNGTHIVTGHA
jgi:hypothetical protein